MFVTINASEIVTVAVSCAPSTVCGVGAGAVSVTVKTWSPSIKASAVSGRRTVLVVSPSRNSTSDAAVFGLAVKSAAVAVPGVVSSRSVTGPATSALR